MIVHPLRQRILRLRGQVDEDAAVGIGRRGFDDGVEDFGAIHDDR